MRCSLTPLKTFSLVTAIAICVALFPAVASAQDDPPAEAGRLSIVNGAVSIQAAGSDDWNQAYLNYPVGPGDRIFTDTDGRAEIQVGRTYVRIGPNSDVTFVDLNQDAVTFGIAQGAMHVRTNGLWDNQSLYVQTPSGSSTVQGPADFRVDVMPQDQAAIFTTFNGDEYVTAAGDFGSDTAAGQSLELVGTNPVSPQWLQPSEGDDLDQWSARRDAQIARAASFRYVNPEIPGAEDMDAYGQWTPGTEYGDMWVPNVPAGWAPYHNGHWMNHDPWGWVWVEDEPWGYAPFHYGRWVNYHDRWGWVPGPRSEHPVWSPALVVFASGISIGGGGVSAWFPLGPGEAYHPWYRCSPRYVDRVNITNIQESRNVHVQNTYVNVTNVTNVTYINRTNVTVVRQTDFASGRNASQAAVRVDPQQLQHVQVVARPEVAPTSQTAFRHPPARAVPVQAARPLLINAKGLAVAAQPKARPMPPPVKAVQVPRPLAGRTVIAPPPNVRMTPAAKQAMQAQPPARQMPPQAPNRPVGAQPGGPGQPAGVPPNQGRPNPAPGAQQAPVPQPLPAIHPADRNTPPAQATPQPGVRPGDRPAPPAPSTPQHPGDRPTPPVQPAPQLGARPGDRPNSSNQPEPSSRPIERTSPTNQPPAPPRPVERNYPAPQQPPPPQRPQERNYPAPQQPPPPQRPPERSYPVPQQPPPPQRPAQENRPAPQPPAREVRPDNPPPGRPAPPASQPRPNVEPAPRTPPPPPRPNVEPQQRPPQRQAPPPPPEKNKKKDESKPQ